MNFKTIGVGLATAAGLMAAAPAQALTFTSSAITFDADTPVVFEFLGGNAAFTQNGQNSFGVLNTATNTATTIFPNFTLANVGTTATFDFEAGLLYKLFLDTPNGVLSSDLQTQITGSNPFLIEWEDLPLENSDEDFNDYLVSATAVPTPALVPAALGFGAAMLRKRKKTEEDAAEANR